MGGDVSSIYSMCVIRTVVLSLRVTDVEAGKTKSVEMDI